MWTIETAKDLLPDVKVKFERKVVKGQLSGRHTDFATVHFRPGFLKQLKVQVSWETVTRTLNNKKPIII